LNQTSVLRASTVLVKQWWLVNIRLSGPTRQALHSSSPLMRRRATALELRYATGSADL